MGMVINGRTPEEIKRWLRWATYRCMQTEDRCATCEYQKDCGEYCGSDTYEEALAYIQHLEAQQPKWIGVEDVPPKENVYYMVSVTLHGNRGMYTDIAMFDGELWVRDAGSYFDVLDKGDITHYMPLPSPSKEDAHD